MRRSTGFAAAAAFSGLLALTLVSMPAAAQRGGRGGDSTAGRGLPMTPTHALKFTTDEGTWLSLDLSPDGRTIVFELIGDLYTLPDRRRKGDAHHERSGVRRAAALFARRQVDRVRQRSVAVGQPLDRQRRRHESARRSRATTTNTHFQSPTFTPDGKYVVVSQGNDLHMYLRARRHRRIPPDR